VEAIAYQEDMLAHRVERIAAALEPHGLIVG
jgi:hypothetical protein